MHEFEKKNLLNAPGLSAWTGKYKEQNPISRFLVGNFYRQIQQIIRSLELQPDDRILETGCGPGLSSLKIQQALGNQHFEVSDIDDDVIDTLGKIGFPIPFRKESVTQLERKDEEFTCVFLLEVLEHVPEYQQALSEIFRVTNKYVVVSTPNEPLWRILNILRGKYISDLGNTPGHVNHWSTKSLSKLISNHGKVVDVFTPTPWTIILAEKNRHGS